MTFRENFSSIDGDNAELSQIFAPYVAVMW